MKVNWITLFVKDLSKSKEFYEDYLGMELEREFSPSDNTIIAFYRADDGSEIELLENRAPEFEYKKISGVSIGIAVDNYKELLSLAREKNILKSEPQNLGSFECFFVTDPDGMDIQVIKE